MTHEKRDATAIAKSLCDKIHKKINPSGNRQYGKTLSYKIAALFVEEMLHEFSRLRNLDNVDNLSDETWLEVKKIIYWNINAIENNL